MPSLNATLLNTIFRWTMKRHGRHGIDIARSRKRSHNLPKRVLYVPADMTVTEIRPTPALQFDVADVKAKREGRPESIVYYLHGGGYFFGSTKTHRQINIALAKTIGGPAYSLEYRLAPERPYPAAVDDALAGYRWLLSQHPHASIIIAGDSAGGGLALAAMLAARTARLPLPAAFIGFSPWTDMAVTGASVEANAKRCAMFTPRGIHEAAQLYLAGADPRDPLASPLYADLSGLPPMLLFASRDEILYHDTTRLAERARAFGVTVEVIERDGLPHVWPIFLRILPEGREALVSVGDFLRRILPASRPAKVLP